MATSSEQGSSRWRLRAILASCALLAILQFAVVLSDPDSVQGFEDADETEGFAPTIGDGLLSHYARRLLAVDAGIQRSFTHTYRTLGWGGDGGGSGAGSSVHFTVPLRDMLKTFVKKNHIKRQGLTTLLLVLGRRTYVCCMLVTTPRVLGD